MSNQKEIEDYLSGAMGALEKAAFQAKMQQDPDLQHQVLQQQKIERAILAAGRKKVKEETEQFWTRQGPIPPPQPSLGDRIRYFYWTHQPTIWIFTVGLFGLIVFFLIWAPQVSDCQVEQLSQNYYQEPVSLLAAGREEFSIALQSNFYYDREELDSLQNLARTESSVFPLYYLAHLHQHQENFTEAQKVYEMVLARKEEWSAYSRFQDQEFVAFNALLVQLAVLQNVEKTITELENLKEEFPAMGTTLKQEIDNLIDELNPCL